MSTNMNILLAGLGAMIYESPEHQSARTRARHLERIHRPTGRLQEDWQSVQLSKADRHGKTPEEIRALRIQKWEEQRHR